MPERSALPPAPAKLLTTLRIALIAAFTVSLGQLLVSGLNLETLLWCVALWIILALIWWLLSSFCTACAQATQPSEARRQAEGAFLSAMGHDLRQPTQAIALFAATLSAHPLPESSHKLVAGIESAIQQLSEQMEAVFGIAKVQAGRVTCTPKPVALEGIFSLLTQAHLDDAHEAGTHLRHATTARQVLADEDILTKILDRLLAHAIRTAKDGGVLLGCRSRGSVVHVEVWSSGSGIKTEDLATVFTLGSAYGQSFPDHGLGLALAQALAAQMSSSLSVASDGQRGSVLRLTLPRA